MKAIKSIVLQSLNIYILEQRTLNTLPSLIYKLQNIKIFNLKGVRDLKPEMLKHVS